MKKDKDWLTYMAKRDNEKSDNDKYFEKYDEQQAKKAQKDKDSKQKDK